MTSYSTNFPGTEAPISEGGAWNQPSSTNIEVDTAGGLAFGTQTGTGGFNDSIALLTAPYAPNQMASAVVHRDASFAPSTTREVEILLRGSAPGGVASWYEINFAWDGAYLQVIWIGAGGFAYIVGNSGGGNPGPAGGIQNGDVVSASIVGNVITAKVNGTTYAVGTDTLGPGGGARITSGNPGIGFWRGGVPTAHDTNAMYSFDSFQAIDTSISIPSLVSVARVLP